jgi:hypothetical protein
MWTEPGGGSSAGPTEKHGLDATGAELWTEQAKIKTRGNDFPEEEAAVLESANT